MASNPHRDLRELLFADLSPSHAGQAMISVLTPDGIQIGAGSADALASDPSAGPVITAATELMAHLIGRSSR